MAEEKTLTVTYLGGLTGDTYSTGEYSMEAGEEYDVPENEAKRLYDDFGPDYFTVEGMGGKKEDEGEVKKASTKKGNKKDK